MLTLKPVEHKSDCAVHNGPAYPPGPCDCGADPIITTTIEDDVRKAEQSFAPSGYRIEMALATWQSMRARLLEDDPALERDEAALSELLGPAEGDVDDILARVLRAAVHAEALADAADEQAKRIAARKKRYEARNETLRGLAFSLMDTVGKRKVELGDLTASITTGRQTARITDEALVPDVYVEEVTVRKIDKTIILADLKAKRDVPGAELSNGLDYLTIKKS